MTRSNKRKKKAKPLEETSDVNNQIPFMVRRAISSGTKHGIKLSHGSSNLGLGNCAFESVISNCNDRHCFEETFPMSANYYRRIWVTDMSNRTVDNPTWNIMSRKEWLEGWSQMLQPGVYERDIFGDLMLPGIACGVKKILLIFNTNADSPHDPIYVVDPRQFGVDPTTDIPIILAYDLTHYESMHPVEEADELATARLVKDYLAGQYRFGKDDIPYLLGIADKVDNEIEDNVMTIKEHKKSWG